MIFEFNPLETVNCQAQVPHNTMEIGMPLKHCSKKSMSDAIANNQAELSELNRDYG
jgi:hypothetical protein